jgi:CDP-diacylglycerol--glycerol-3-phosphate 3-phosphatidyltransferase
MTFANLITLSRILSLPLIIYLVLQDTLFHSFLAIIVITWSITSDYLDGYLAKLNKNITKIGSFLDPLADKILIIGIISLFLINYNYLLIPLIIFILRDIIVTTIRIFSARENINISTNKLGKFEINTQYVLIYALLIGKFLRIDHLADTTTYFLLNKIIFVFAILSVFMSILSVINYIFYYKKEIRIRKRNSKSIDEESMLLLANNRARGFKDKYRRRLLDIFSRRRNLNTIYLPNNKDMFNGLKINFEEVKQIIVAGGDGTFESALNNPLLHKKSLGFFPLGGGNAFYSYFYKGKRFEYLRSRFNFRETEIDVIELEYEHGKRETLFFGIGADAEVMRLGKGRTTGGLRDYIKGCLFAIIKGKAKYNFTVNIDGKEKIWKNAVNINCGKIQYYGYGIRSLLSKVKKDDNYVYGIGIINKHNSYLNKLIRIWALILTITNTNCPPLVPFRGKNIVIKSDEPFPIQAGGEFLGYSKWIKLKIKRKQKVLVI